LPRSIRPKRWRLCLSSRVWSRARVGNFERLIITGPGKRHDDTNHQHAAVRLLKERAWHLAAKLIKKAHHELDEAD
jgi:hypothetical protein